VSRAWVVFAKEVVDNLRDRRSNVTALLYALLGPLVLIPMLTLVGRVNDTKVLRVPIDGAANAPALVEYLRTRDIEAAAAPDDAERAVRDLKEDVVLIIPPTYADDFRAGRPATVRLVADHSRTTSQGEISRVTHAIQEYGHTVGALRLVARGVSPSVVAAIAIETDDVASPESKGAMLLAIVPMFLLMSLLIGGAHVAIDATAGERERGSLEPLLATPLRSSEVVLGKLGAVMLFAVGALVACALGFTLAIRFAPVPEIPGMKFELGPAGTLQMVAALLPLLLPVAALQILLASRSRTVKEAQAAAMLLSGLPAIPGMFLVFVPFKATTTWMTVPVFAQELLVNQILRGAPVAPLDHAIATASSIALGVVLTIIAIARYARARTLAQSQ
jgi:sodium transport system permease protein